MIDIAKHIRVFHTNPDDDFVTKRTSAINAIEQSFRKNKTVISLLKLANSLAIGIEDPALLNSTIAATVEKEIKKQSSSFVAEGQQLQMISCALAAAHQFVDKETQASTKLALGNVLGIGLWNALSFQPPIADKPKLEDLRLELIKVSYETLSAAALLSRNRLEVPEIKQISVTDVTTVPQLIASVNKIFPTIIEPLKTNAALDREEIDVLWWILNNWSDIAKMRLTDLNEVQRSVISGIELADLLRRFPHKAHHRLAIRTIKDDKSYNAVEMLEQMGNLLEPITLRLGKESIIKEVPAVFPLFTLLNSRETAHAGCDIKRPVSEWAGRAILEGAMINLSKFLHNGQ